jgi:hypothetical protein
MLKKTITYTDYNDVQRTEDFYFNLTKAEIATMELSTEGGFVEKLNRVIAAKDTPTLIAVFKDLILDSYGEKSLDGKKFIKNKELSDSFCQTEAYSQLFMELASDANAASTFVNGIIPADLRQKLNK